MKRLATILVATLALAAAPAFAQKVTIDYAHEFDFDSIKTFQYHETDDSNLQDPLMDSRVKEALIRALTAGGLKEVDSKPDIYVTYHQTSW